MYKCVSYLHVALPYCGLCVLPLPGGMSHNFAPLWAHLSHNFAPLWAHLSHNCAPLWAHLGLQPLIATWTWTLQNIWRVDALHDDSEHIECYCMHYCVFVYGLCVLRTLAYIRDVRTSHVLGAVRAPHPDSSFHVCFIPYRRSNSTALSTCRFMVLLCLVVPAAGGPVNVGNPTLARLRDHTRLLPLLHAIREQLADVVDTSLPVIDFAPIDTFRHYPHKHVWWELLGTLYTSCLYQLGKAEPDDAVVFKLFGVVHTLHAISVKSCFMGHAWVALALLTNVATILCVRSQWCKGRKSCLHGFRSMRAFGPQLQAAMARVGPANAVHILVLCDFLRDQVHRMLTVARHDAHQHVVYQLGIGAHYVGRAAGKRASGCIPGPVVRFREHVRQWSKLLRGAPRKTIVEVRRYKVLYAAFPTFLPILFLDHCQKDHAPHVEAAHIGFLRPSANDIPESYTQDGLVDLNRNPDSVGKPRPNNSRSQRESVHGLHLRVERSKFEFQSSMFRGYLRESINRDLERKRHVEAKQALKMSWNQMFAVVLGTLSCAGLYSVAPNIYSLPGIPLLIKYACRRPLEVEWNRLVSAFGGNLDVLYSMWELQHLVTNMYDRMRYRESLGSYLRSCRLPVPHQCVLRIPQPYFKHHARCWMMRLTQILRPTFPTLARLLHRHTRIIVSASKNFKRALVNAHIHSQRINLDDLSNLDRHVMHAAANGFDMHKLSVHGRWAVRVDKFTLIEKFNHGCALWAGEWFPRVVFQRRLWSINPWSPLSPLSQTSHLLNRPAAVPNLTSTEEVHEKLYHQLDSVKGDVNITVEDKDPTQLWVEDVLGSHLRWIGQLAGSGNRWQVVEVCITALVTWYQVLFDFAFPANLTRRTPISINSLPYAYHTVKGKCWSPAHLVTGTAKLCQKAGHSCYRNIISFAHFPGRPVFRAFSRALTFLVNKVTPGWSFTSLETAFDEIRSHSEVLLPPAATYCCTRCRDQMLVPGCLVCDAGQAYEAIPLPVIYQCLNSLRSEVQSKQQLQRLQVFHDGSRGVVPGGKLDIKYVDRTIVIARTLFCVVFAYLGMRIYRLGKCCLLQLHGIPIGGPMSTAVLHMVLSRAEFLYDRLHPSRHRIILCRRYADDLVMISNRLCRKCLISIVHRVYSGVAEFEADSSFKLFPGVFVQPFLDGVLYVSFNGVTVGYFPKNFKFALTGDFQHIKKNSFCPPGPSFNREVCRTLRAELAGRLHRVLTVTKCPMYFALFVLLDCFQYLRLGYTKTDLNKMWYGQKLDHEYTEIMVKSKALVMTIAGLRDANAMYWIALFLSLLVIRIEPASRVTPCFLSEFFQRMLWISNYTPLCVSFCKGDDLKVGSAQLQKAETQVSELLAKFNSMAWRNRNNGNSQPYWQPSGGNQNWRPPRNDRGNFNGNFNSNPIGRMASDYWNFVGDGIAMAQMTQLGQNALQQQPHMAAQLGIGTFGMPMFPVPGAMPPAAPGQPTSPTGSAAAPGAASAANKEAVANTEHLVEVVAGALSKRKDHANVQGRASEAIERLSEFVPERGSMSQETFNKMLNDSGAFKEVRAEVAGLSSEMRGMKATVDKTSIDTATILSLMKGNQSADRPAPRGPGPSGSGSRGPGGSSRGPPGPPGAGAGGPPGGPPSSGVRASPRAPAPRVVGPSGLRPGDDGYPFSEYTQAAIADAFEDEEEAAGFMTPRGSHRLASPDSVRLPEARSGAPVYTAMFKESEVHPEDHDIALPIFGARATRQEMIELREELEASPLPFVEYWRKVKKIKSQQQWTKRMVAYVKSLGLTEEGAQAEFQGCTNIDSIGGVIFSKLRSDGTWSPGPMQVVPEQLR